MPAPIRILILDDAADDADRMLRHIRFEGFAPCWERVASAGGLRDALGRGRWDVVLAESALPGCGAAAALAAVRDSDPDLPFVLVSGSVGEEAAVELMRAGASDYVLKDNLARLGPAVAREVREAENRRARRLAELEAEKLAAIIRSTDDAVIGKDLAGTIRSWNPAAEQMYGWAAADAIGRPIDLVVPPDRHDELAGIMARIRAGELVDHFETVRWRRDGTRLDVSLTISPIRDHTGRVVGASKIARDITARRRADAERQDLAHQYSNLFDLAVIGIFRSTPAGRYLAVNPAFARIFGYPTAADLLADVTDIGRQLYADPRQRAEYVRLLSERQTMLGFECEGRRRDGAPIWIRLDARAVRDAQGGLLYFEGFAQDITDRKRAERKLQDSERFLRSSLDALSAHIAILDAAGTILAVNEVWSRFGRDNHLSGANGEVGSNYLAVCDAATGDCAEEARAAADGIRAVLSGAAPTFSLAYPCHSPTEQRWFMLRATRFEGTDGVRVVVAHENVTEVKRGEEVLRRTTELLNAVASGTPDAVFVKDLDGRYLLCNPAAARYVGRGIDEVLGRDDTALFDPDSARQVMAVDRRVMATGEMETNEETLTAAGVTRTYLATKGPYRDRDGRVVGVLGISRDVTDRKRAEQAVRESEARFRAFMDNGPFLAWITEAEGRIDYASGPFTRALSVPDGGVEGLHLTDVFPPEAARTYLENNREVVHTGRVLATTEPGVLADGSPGQFLVYKFPIPAAGRALVGGVAIDITERARLQAELVMRDRAIQAVPLGIVITDPTRPDNPITYASPGFEWTTGYPPAEVVGRNCRFLQGADTDWAEVARLRAALAAGDEYRGELLNYRKDGTAFWNEVSITPVRDADGRLVNFIGIQTDVTARRSLEDQLRQAQKMEAVGRLAGGVAHDFNNLLTVINGYSELALGETRPGHPLREPLAAIRDAGERAATLTQQLLAFSRRAIVAPRVLDVNAVVESIARLLRRLIGEDILLATVLTPTACRVRIDPGQIEQVVMNLAVNARDAMPHRGRLTVETGVERTASVADGCPPGRYVRLTVRDTGVGMTDAVKGRIFEPFFTTKEVGKGTGLGLAMVYGTVKQAGGFVRVESAVGRGTTFDVLLPEVEAADAGATADGIPLAPRGSETVLVAEDEDAVRRFTRLALELQGYHVLEASSGTEARDLALAHAGPIHLLVTDVVMPDLGGRELADAVRARRADVGVLYVSGYTDDAVVRHGVEEAAHAFLQKPFTPLTLARKVREVLDALPVGRLSPAAPSA